MPGFHPYLSLCRSISFLLNQTVPVACPSCVCCDRPREFLYFEDQQPSILRCPIKNPQHVRTITLQDRISDPLVLLWTIRHLAYGLIFLHQDFLSLQSPSAAYLQCEL